jgi:hypothetical protein
MCSWTTALPLIALTAALTSTSAEAVPIAARGPAHWADKTADLPSDPVTLVAVDPLDDKVIYAGFDGFLFRSDDAGESWAPILSFPRGMLDDGALDDTAADAFDGAANGQSTDNVALDAASSDTTSGTGEVFDDDDSDNDANDPEASDNDDGVTGGDRSAGDDPVDAVDISTPGRLGPGVRAIAFVPGSKGVFLVATSRGLFRTTSAGSSFVRLTVPGGLRENDIRDIGVEPNRPSRLWIATGGGLFVSVDGGATIDREGSRLGSTPIVDISVDAVGPTAPAHLLIGSERGVMRSRDGGETFADLLLRGAVAFPLVHAVGWANETIYVGTEDGLFVGVRNAPILERYTGVPEAAPSAISPDPAHQGGVAIGFRGVGGSEVVFSDDDGLTSVPVDSLPAQSPLSLARERADSSRIWVATDRGVFRLEPGTGIRVSRDELKALRDRFAHEPDIATVTQLALKSHSFDRSDRDARDRAALAGWLPELRVRLVLQFGDTSRSTSAFVFRDPSTLPPVTDPNADNEDLFGDGLAVSSPTRTDRQQLWLWAAWDLDKVILNPDMLRSARQIPLLRNAERAMVDRTRQLYVARRRLVAEIMTPTGKQTVRERINAELRLREVEAQITALTNEDLFAASTSPESR